MLVNWSSSFDIQACFVSKYRCDMLLKKRIVNLRFCILLKMKFPFARPLVLHLSSICWEETV